MTGIWWTSASIEIFLCSLTATTAHLLMSLGQTLFHRYLGHRFRTKSAPLFRDSSPVSLDG